MAIDAEQSTLPGFESIAPVLAKASEFRDLAEMDYTAEELYLRHRERYEIAAFLTNCGLGLSDRFVCKACKLNVRTLKAIKMREDGKESAALLFKKRVRSFAKLINFHVLQELHDRLNDPDALASLSIGDLQKAKTLADEFAREGTSGEQHDETIIDVDADAFDDALASNRFDAQKKRAPDSAALECQQDGAPMDAPGCSTANKNARSISVNEQQYPINEGSKL